MLVPRFFCLLGRPLTICARITLFLLGFSLPVAAQKTTPPAAEKAASKKPAKPAAKKTPETDNKAAAQTTTPTRSYATKTRHLAAPDLLRSGPMVGYATMRTVALWAQLTRSGGAQIEYWEKGKPERRWRSAIVLATEANDFTTHLLADSVLPGKRYTYRLWVADDDHPRLRVIERPYPLEFQSQALWQWRTDPPSFRVALGSCTYVNDSIFDRPGRPYGGQYSIFKAIDQNRPDVMLWLGDNAYYREADWDSPLSMRRRYAHTRALPELQPLLGSVHHYAIWDDHDYGPNDADRSFVLREESLNTFKLFWANPSYGAGGSGGITGTFQWADVQFFLLDDRWNRTPDLDDPAHGQYLGATQLRWLTEALAASTATFKVVAVGGQVLNPTTEFENYANYATERTELLRRLAELKVPGVLFVSGDRHFAELSILDRPGLYPLYDLTTSPLTSSPISAERAGENPLRVGGTLAAERNFALFDVSGPLTDRKLTMTLCNAEGQPIWKRDLQAHDLRPGASPMPPPPAADAAPVPPKEAVGATPGRSVVDSTTVPASRVSRPAKRRVPARSRRSR